MHRNQSQKNLFLQIQIHQHYQNPHPIHPLQRDLNSKSLHLLPELFQLENSFSDLLLIFVEVPFALLQLHLLPLLPLHPPLHLLRFHRFHQFHHLPLLLPLYHLHSLRYHLNLLNHHLLRQDSHLYLFIPFFLQVLHPHLLQILLS
jgi:hypothetical protein